MTGRRALPFLAALLVPACAALEIEVDVYKGPLANERHVQVQQVSVMAMGAKPLLVQLRDLLEAREAGKDVVDVRSDASYEPGYIRPRYKGENGSGENGSGEYEFCSTQALRVNNILSLYDDREAGGANQPLVDLLRQGLREVGRLERAAAVLSPKQSELASQSKDILGSAADQHSALTKAYKEALTEGSLDGLLGKLQSNSALPAKDDGYTEKVRFILRNGVVGDHAKRLFKDEDVRKRFVTNVERVARAFLDARDALRELLELALQFGIEFHSGAYDDLPHRRKYNEKLAEIVADLTRTAVAPKVLFSAGTEISEENVRDALRARLVDSPKTEYANTLRDHRKFQQDVTFGPRGFSKKRRVYGIARGPRPSEGKSVGELVETIESGLKALLAELVNPLDGGRLPDGLEGLIEAYLEAHEQPRETPHRDDDEERELESLLDALARFAQKVLVIANFEGLFGEDGGPKEDERRYIRVLQAIGNSILSQVDELRHRAGHRRRGRTARPFESAALDAVLNPTPNEVLQDTIDRYRGGAEDRKNQADQKERAAKEQDELAQEAGKAGDAAAARAARLRKAVDDSDWPQFKVGASDVLEERREAALAKVAEESIKTLVEDAMGAVPDGTKVATVEELVAEIAEAVPQAKRSGVKTAMTPEFKAALAFPRAALDKALTGHVGTLEVKDAVLEAIAGLPREPKTFASVKDYADAVKKRLETLRQASAEDRRRAADRAVRASKRAKRARDEEIKLRAEADKHERAAKGVEEVAPALLGSETARGRRPHPHAVFVHLRLLVQERIEARKAAGESVDNLESAAELLRDDPPPPTLARAEPLEGGSSKDVLDELIAMLRHEHVMAVRSGGEKSAQALRIQAALEAAYVHRSGMIYLRPASAFLRNSYPATTLQENRLGWRNMLDERLLRSIPFSGLFRSKEKEQNLEIQQEIDKQFWQSINQVRVSGGGVTNYVVVKDDIGNWYVKDYSADPEKMIQSVQNMALFGASQRAGTDLQSLRDSIRRRKEGGAAPARADLESTTLGRQLKRIETRYLAETEAQLAAVREAIGTMPADVKRVWQGADFTEEERTKLDRAADGAKAAQLDGPLANEDAGVADLLRAILRFHATVVRDADSALVSEAESEVAGKRTAHEAAKEALVKTVTSGADLTDPSAAEKKARAELQTAVTELAAARQKAERARTLLASVVGPPLRRHLADRQKTVARRDHGVGFVAETVVDDSQEAAKEDEAAGE